jgi:hypothetical protein
MNTLRKRPLIVGMAVATWFACVGAASTPHTLSCRVESAFNTSISEKLIPAEEPIRHRLADLELAGDTLTRTEEDRGPDFEVQIVHQIDRNTGRFLTTRYETRHDMGEHWEIRLTGSCEPVEALARYA